jgi:hypothetical protein
VPGQSSLDVHRLIILRNLHQLFTGQLEICPILYNSFSPEEMISLAMTEVEESIRGLKAWQSLRQEAYVKELEAENIFNDRSCSSHKAAVQRAVKQLFTES